MKPTAESMRDWQGPWGKEGAHHKQPAPFAGRYPTRIWWRVINARSATMIAEYFGKPSKGAVEELLTLLRKRGEERVIVYAAEIDREGLVWRSEQVERGRNIHFVPFVFGNLWRYYHPFSAREAGLTEFAQGMVRKRIRVERKIHTVYAPAAKRLKMQRDIEPFRVWVRGWVR